MEYSIRTQSSKLVDYLQICLCYYISSMSLMRESCHHVWGWYYLSTILDDYSRYIITWKLCTTMRADDVTDTIEMALQASGCDQAIVQHKTASAQ
jgi:transposase InsO family protein